MKSYDRSILRLIDANLNRAIEGIRVLEESARMLFDDAAFTHELKSLRHSLLSLFSADEKFRTGMILARGADRDVLRNGETVSEGTRTGLADLLRANASRAREAVRNLEEYGKLVGAGISEQCKGIRFRLYDVEQLLICRIIRDEKAGEERLRLMVLIEPREHRDIGETASAAAGAGAGIIVCCDSRFSGIVRVRHLEAIVDGVSDGAATVLGWDRADIALSAGADGVLLAPGGIGVDAIRAISPHSWVVGKTVPDNGEFEIRSTVDDGADFVFLGMDTTGQETCIDPDDCKECIDAMPVPVIVSVPPDEGCIADMFDAGAAGIALHTDGENPAVIGRMRSLVDRLAGEVG